jgi:ribonucleoside-triphosphate reductase
LQAANYDCFENPYDKTGMVVRFPVCWDHVVFDNVNGLEINTESAVTQLERYRLLMETYVDQNVSITVSYDQSEIEEIIDWILTYWNSYVATAFLPRLDPTKTAADLGYPYLPQEVVSKETYEAYVNTLLPVTLNNQDSIRDLDETDCPNGVCPVR